MPFPSFSLTPIITKLPYLLYFTLPYNLIPYPGICKISSLCVRVVFINRHLYWSFLVVDEYLCVSAFSVLSLLISWKVNFHFWLFKETILKYLNKYPPQKIIKTTFIFVLLVTSTILPPFLTIGIKSVWTQFLTVNSWFHRDSFTSEF